jgi:1,2-diacylglycerol 3-alpha-glucosyltransferase
MHVLMLSDVYFPRINGVSTSIATFRRSLGSIGTRCTLVAPSYRERNQESDSAPEPDVHRVPAHRIPFDPEDRLMSARAFGRVLAGIDYRDIDLVHVQTPFLAHRDGVRYARRHGLPVVETYHTHFEEYFHHYLPWLPRRALRAATRAFSRRQCNALDAVIVPSPAMREVLLSYGVERPVEVLPTGLDLAQFREGDGARFRRSHGIAPERPVLVVVSRVAHEKNLDFLVHVAERVRVEFPDLLLVVAGEGPARPHLQSLAASRGLDRNVLFVGYLERGPALNDCYRAGDVFVFASRSETQGLVLLEAMALGVPVVALAQLGTQGIVGPGRGAVAAPDDVAGFAAEVASLLRDPSRRAALSAEATVFAGEWNTDLVATRLNALYAAVSAAAAPLRRLPGPPPQAAAAVASGADARIR